MNDACFRILPATFVDPSEGFWSVAIELCKQIAYSAACRKQRKCKEVFVTVRSPPISIFIAIIYVRIGLIKFSLLPNISLWHLRASTMMICNLAVACNVDACMHDQRLAHGFLENPPQRRALQPDESAGPINESFAQFGNVENILQVGLQQLQMSSTICSFKHRHLARSFAHAL